MSGNELPDANDVFTHALQAAIAGLGDALERPNRTKEFYLANPVLWAKERGDRVLWSRQAEVIEAVRDSRRVAVKSCHSTGKTTGAATLACWWIDNHEPGEAFVITTAPTGPQVKALLWREINRLHKKAGLSGRVNLTEWYLDGELVAFGRKSSDYDENAFQGVHALKVLVIIDEANGVAESLWDAAESIASNKYGKVLAIGNPDNPDSVFAKRCASDVWHTIHIGYRDTPNFTGEDVPEFLLDSLISREWVDEREREWGRDSAIFQSKCMGEFPDKSTEQMTVIPYGMASLCRNTDPDPLSGLEVQYAGIDVGAGGDSTVLAQRVGARAGAVVEFKDPDPMATVGRMAIQLREWGTTRGWIDVGGVGWGIYGRLRELGPKEFGGLGGDSQIHSCEVIAVNFGAKSTQPKRFLNKRAELWWTGRELSRTIAWSLDEVSDDMVAQLCAPRYKVLDSQGKIQVESKAEVIKRLGRSPDLADALLLAFCDMATEALTITKKDKNADLSAMTVFSGDKLIGGPNWGGSSNPFVQGVGALDLPQSFTPRRLN